MKTLSFLVVLFVGMSINAQSKQLNGNSSNPNVITSNIGITLNANSLKEIEALNDEEVRSIFEKSSPNQTIYFEFICKKSENPDLDFDDFSIKITGNSNDLDAFMNRYKRAKAKVIELHN